MLEKSQAGGKALIQQRQEFEQKLQVQKSNVKRLEQEISQMLHDKLRLDQSVA